MQPERKPWCAAAGRSVPRRNGPGRWGCRLGQESSSTARRWWDGNSASVRFSGSAGGLSPAFCGRREAIVPHNFVLSDLVLQAEPNRQFAASEIRAGRWPLWTPYQFAGSPFVGLSQVFAVQDSGAIVWRRRWFLHGPNCCWPCSSAWELTCFVVAFCGLGLWPAVLAAWCWPLTGYFVFWQGYSLPFAVGWLPWILLAVDKTVRRASRWAGLGLAAATCLVLTQRSTRRRRTSAVGVRAICRLVLHRRVRQGVLHPAHPAAAGHRRGGLDVGVPVGLRPTCCRLLEYSRTGTRMARAAKARRSGRRWGWPPCRRPSCPTCTARRKTAAFAMFPTEVEGNQLESSAATYTGLLATLLVAPLAWCSRRHRSINVFWVAPGVPRLELVSGRAGGRRSVAVTPGLNMMSHNRFVFATSFAILAMMAVGLDVLRQGDVRWRLWFWAPVAVLAMLLLWCGYRTTVLPEPSRPNWSTPSQRATCVPGIADLAAVARVQATFVRSYAVAAVLCVLGIAGWLLLGLRAKWRPWLLSGAGALALGRPALVCLWPKRPVRSGTVLSPDSGLGATGEGGPRPDHWLPLPAGDTCPDARPARHSRL